MRTKVVAQQFWRAFFTYLPTDNSDNSRGFDRLSVQLIPADSMSSFRILFVGAIQGKQGVNVNLKENHVINADNVFGTR